MAGLPANDRDGQSTQKLILGGRPAPRRVGKTLFARKGEASPLVDKKGGAEAPEDVVVETRATRLREDDSDFDTSLQIINERSEEAGYPDNPIADEMTTQYFDVADIYSTAAPEAEAGFVEMAPEPVERTQQAPSPREISPQVLRASPPEVISTPEAKEPPQSPPASAARQRQPESPQQPQPERRPQAGRAPTRDGPALAPSAPQAPSSVSASGRRARISIQMTAAEYLRLKLGAAVLGFDEAELINTALAEYLDNWGVDSLADCARLKGAVELFESSASDD